MAKFSHWRNPTEMARDLKRGLYQLTFKDNMPNEPEVKNWYPDIKSTTGTAFTIDAANSNTPTYSVIGNRCFFKINGLRLSISGNAQSVFWLRLPVPAKSLTEGRWMGHMFCPYPRAIFVNALVEPNEWWLRLESHSETASIGTFPVTGDASLAVSGDFEIHPAYLRTGTLQERDVPFESYSTSVWTDFSSTLAPRKTVGLPEESITNLVIHTALYTLINDFACCQVCFSGNSPNSNTLAIRVLFPFRFKSIGQAVAIPCGLQSTTFDYTATLLIDPSSLSAGGTAVGTFLFLSAGRIPGSGMPIGEYFSLYASFTCPLER